MHRTALGVLSCALLLACFDEVDPKSGGDGASTGDETGDGDGDPGDGDGDPGDGDGDPGDGDGEGDGDGDQTGDSDDTEAPSIVSLDPPDGAIGVSADATIVIEFNEPMDKMATEAAFQSATLPPVTFGWSGGDTILEVTPIDPLAYASGSDPNAVEAQSYSYLLGTGARDLAGNTLEQAEAASFTTLRRITQSFEDDPTLTGWVRSDGSTGTNPQAGDSQSTAQYKIVASLPMPLPPATHSIVSATLSGEQTGVLGSPYTDLGGELVVRHLQYNQLTAAVFGTSTLADMGVLSNSPALGVYELEVTSAVHNTWFGVGNVSAADRVQFRLEFGLPTDGDNEHDRAVFAWGYELEVVYLLP